MKLSSLIILFLCYNNVQAQQQVDNRSSFNAALIMNFNTTTTTPYIESIARPTPLPTNTSESSITGTISNINSTTATINSTIIGSIPFFSSSPTSFVFTHFPVLPFHTALSSSSMISSARPSQSAPFPDDTIGKNGRLHISKATTTVSIHPFLCCSLLVLSSIFIFS